jgi:hypothetical protein
VPRDSFLYERVLASTAPTPGTSLSRVSNTFARVRRCALHDPPTRPAISTAGSVRLVGLFVPCLALPTAKIAVMGSEAAINAVYANKIAEINDEAERSAYVERLRKEYEIDIGILRLARELVVDGIVEPREVRRELIARFAPAATKDRQFSGRRHGIPPVQGPGSRWPQQPKADIGR